MNEHRIREIVREELAREAAARTTTEVAQKVTLDLLTVEELAKKLTPRITDRRNGIAN